MQSFSSVYIGFLCQNRYTKNNFFVLEFQKCTGVKKRPEKLKTPHQQKHQHRKNKKHRTEKNTSTGKVKTLHRKKHQHQQKVPKTPTPAPAPAPAPNPWFQAVIFLSVSVCLSFCSSVCMYVIVSNKQTRKGRTDGWTKDKEHQIDGRTTNQSVEASFCKNALKISQKRCFVRYHFTNLKQFTVKFPSSLNSKLTES
jgi:outer membrane biosynthesis protein TonB